MGVYRQSLSLNRLENHMRDIYPDLWVGFYRPTDIENIDLDTPTVQLDIIAQPEQQNNNNHNNHNNNNNYNHNNNNHNNNNNQATIFNHNNLHHHKLKT